MTFGVGTAQAAPRAECQEDSVDFNGDGCADIVVGDPGAAVSGTARAGRINVVYGGEGDKVALLSQGQAGVGDTPEADDGFGSVVRTLKVNADKYTDLVVGVPSESVGTADDAGAVHVIYGSAAGLGGGQAALVLRQGAGGIAGTPKAGDRFGAALGVNRTTDRDEGMPSPGVAVGAPGVDVDGAADAGAAGVVHFDGETGGVAEAAMITQNSPGISGGSEAGDRFGTAVDVYAGGSTNGVRGYTLAVGVPGEDLETTKDAGMVHVATSLSSDAPLTQETAGVAGTPETGDQFGAALSAAAYHEIDGPTSLRLAIGVPTEDIGSVADAGMAYLFFTEDKDEVPLSQRWSVDQDIVGVADTAEAGDRFGSVLELEGARHDTVGSLLVGLPNEDVGAAADAGAVHRFDPMAGAPATNNTLITQSNYAGKPEAGDHFGAALSSRPEGSELVGAPDDVTHSQGAAHGFLRGVFVPGSDGVPAGAVRFGAAVA
ncbi:hypothetical protein [Spirillospora sp. CA-294931]|uniref:hypothetical protein n=1 Tax=Spirillospora sp. CA-294931 TaxID=3240042 RepID=UPI003D920BA5